MAMVMMDSNSASSGMCTTWPQPMPHRKLLFHIWQFCCSTKPWTTWLPQILFPKKGSPGKSCSQHNWWPGWEKDAWNRERVKEKQAGWGLLARTNMGGKSCSSVVWKKKLSRWRIVSSRIVFELSEYLFLQLKCEALGANAAPDCEAMSVQRWNMRQQVPVYQYLGKHWVPAQHNLMEILAVTE